MAMERFLMAIMMVCIVTVSISAASAVEGEDSDLRNIISSLDKSGSNSKDVAQFLNNHGFIATAIDGYTLVRLMGKIYKITPSADKPGSYETEIMVQQCPNTRMYEEDRISTQRS